MLAPVFAAALATRNSWDAFLVGLAASVGFAKAMSDEAGLTERGHPGARGLICGAMTGAFCDPALVVLVELAVISGVRHS